MYTKPLTSCSDDELQGLVRISRLIGNDPTPVFAEMGERVASECTARKQAEDDRHYVAREGRDHRWYVWDCVSDHRVDFN